GSISMSSRLGANEARPAKMACECASTSPGNTVLPSRSITDASDDASASTSACEPTLTNLPSRTAKACATGRSASDVKTLALMNTVSGAGRATATQANSDASDADKKPLHNLFMLRSPFSACDALGQDRASIPQGR